MAIRRRTFLKGCSALAVLAGARLNGLALAAPTSSQDILVVLSLRGGWDALSAVVPREGENLQHYLAARPTLAVRKSLNLNGTFGLHPSLKPLMPLWRAGRLAIVQATGLQQDLRSHFEAIASMEAGAAARRTGWLGRFVSGAGSTSGYPAVSIGTPSMAFQGYDRTLTLESVADLDFHLTREDILTQLYAGPTSLDSSGREAIKALQAARRIAKHEYKPAQPYPQTELGDRLREAARMMKSTELAVRALTLEMEGWDTHSYQQDILPTLFSELAEGLLAFCEDLEGHRFTLVVMSEFGRRVAENASGGTDHGHGSAMLVLGPSVKGGIYGAWPGLDKEQLYDLKDLAVTTDYRAVLSEILSSRMSSANLGEIFPGYAMSPPLGFISC